MSLHSYVSVHPIKDVGLGGHGIVGWIAVDRDNDDYWNAIEVEQQSSEKIVYSKIATRGKHYFSDQRERTTGSVELALSWEHKTYGPPSTIEIV